MVKISKTKHVTKDRVVKRNPVHKKKVPFYDFRSISDKLMKDVVFPSSFLKARNTKKDDYEIKEKLYIVEGPKGVVVSVDTEGVHWIVKNINESIKINIWKKPTRGKDGKITAISMMSAGTFEKPIKEILALNPTVKMTHVKDMVRTFGGRLDSNYRLLLGSLQKIGLNLKDYNTDRKGARYGL